MTQKDIQVGRTFSLQRWLVVGVYVVLLFVFSSQPESSAGHMQRQLFQWLPFLSNAEIRALVFYLRKSGHVVAYALGTWLILYAVKATPRLKRVPYRASLAIALLVAVGDEWYQSVLPHRTGLLADVFVDAIGIGIALIIARFVSSRRRSWKDNEPTQEERGSDGSAQDE